MNENDPDNATKEIELLSFRVSGEDYAMDIGATREIRGWTPPLSMPDTPPYILGVINLRGAILPLLDLSVRLGLDPQEPSERNVIIVTEIDGVPMGLLVESVSDIIARSEEDMEPPPESASNGDHSFVKFLTLVGEKMVRILDLSSVIPKLAPTDVEAA